MGLLLAANNQATRRNDFYFYFSSVAADIAPRLGLNIGEKRVNKLENSS
jgi:hypothetical protein